MLDRFKFLSTRGFDEHRARAQEIIPEIVRLDPTAPGPFRCDVSAIPFETTADCTGFFSVHQSSALSLVATPSTGVRLVIPTTSSLEVVLGSVVRAMPRSGLAGLMPADELQLNVGAGHHLCACLNRARVAAAMREFDCDAEVGPILERVFFEPRLCGLQELADHVRRLIASFDDTPDEIVDLPAFRAAHEQLLVLRLGHLLATAVVPDRRPAVGRNSAALWRAKDFIEAHADRHVDLTEMARYTGLSLRSLQILFRENLDCTIVQYIQQRRLRNVRDRLERSEPGASIAEVARRSGFTHLGHFARAYKGTFGEQPRQTIQRARSKSAG